MTTTNAAREGIGSAAEATTDARIAQLAPAMSPDLDPTGSGLARRLALVTIAGALAILDGSVGGSVDAEELAHEFLNEDASIADVASTATLLFGIAVAHIASWRPSQADRVAPAVHTAIIGWLSPTLAAYGRITTAAARSAGPQLSVPAPQLTRREQDVLRALARSADTAELCAELCIAPGTLKHHIRHLCQKLDARNRFEALLTAQRLRLV